MFPVLKWLLGLAEARKWDITARSISTENPLKEHFPTPNNQLSQKRHYFDFHFEQDDIIKNCNLIIKKTPCTRAAREDSKTKLFSRRISEFPGSISANYTLNPSLISVGESKKGPPESWRWEAVLTIEFWYYCTKCRWRWRMRKELNIRLLRRKGGDSRIFSKSQLAVLASYK